LRDELLGLEFLSSTSTSLLALFYLVESGRSSHSSLSISQYLFFIMERRFNSDSIGTSPFLLEIAISLSFCSWDRKLFFNCQFVAGYGKKEVDPARETVKFGIGKLGYFHRLFCALVVSSAQLSVGVISPCINLLI
jgi:hypothetical protein